MSTVELATCVAGLVAPVHVSVVAPAATAVAELVIVKSPVVVSYAAEAGAAWLTGAVNAHTGAGQAKLDNLTAILPLAAMVAPVVKPIVTVTLVAWELRVLSVTVALERAPRIAGRVPTSVVETSASALFFT